MSTDKMREAFEADAGKKHLMVGKHVSGRKGWEMSNVNNCDSCQHKNYPDGGWCYMFRLEPTERCMKHSNINLKSIASRISTAMRYMTKESK